MIAGLLARLTTVSAPPELRGSGTRGAAAPGDRLLHRDLHYDNILAPDHHSPHDDRGPWPAIDPRPLAGDPGFDLFPALDNRFERDEIRWRFDAMTDVIGIDRERARAWTLARVLQNALWSIESGSQPAPHHLTTTRHNRWL